MTQLSPAGENPLSLYKCVFPKAEYDERISNARRLLSEMDCDCLLIASPQNLNYFTGFDGWSFYTPQFLAVTPARAFLAVRAMDAPAGHVTTYLDAADILEYPESYVDNVDAHPIELVYNELCFEGVPARIGLELDANYFRARYLIELQRLATESTLVDATEHINKIRMVKSPLELDYIRRAAKIADKVLNAAITTTREGTPASHVAAAANFVQSRYGTYTAIQPMIMVNERGSHMNWTADPFAADQVVALELAAAYHHYHCPIARTIVVGESKDAMSAIVAGVLQSMGAALDAVRPGVTCEHVYQTFEATMNQHGLSKTSRVGYSFGLGFPPDWGENTCSVRPDDQTKLQENMCIHLIVGCGDEWGFELSEAIIVRADGPELLCQSPRCLFGTRDDPYRTHPVYRSTLLKYLPDRIDMVENANLSLHMANSSDIVEAMREMPYERPGIEPTELKILDNIAGVNRVHVKDESSRMGLNSFKVLGASYALERLIASGKVKPGDTLTTMTDGNHGKGLAFVAQKYGCKCFIFVPENMVEARKQAMVDLGATVEVVKGDYDAAVAYSNEQARVNGWHFISDQSLEDYREIPMDIMTGYMTLFYECEQQVALESITHVFLQVGVGGLAGAGAAWLASHSHIKLVLVEPDDADCLFVSIEHGRLMESTKNIDSVMAGLNCGTPSIAALPLLLDRADYAITISDSWAERACKHLHQENIVAGESGGAGLAGLLAVLENDMIRDKMGIDDTSNVLVINSEGDTDPVNYQRIIQTAK